MNRSAAYAIGPVILVVLVVIGALGLGFLQPETDRDVSRGLGDLEETLETYGVLPHGFDRNNEQARVLVLVGRACVVVTGRYVDRVTADKAKYAAVSFLDGNGFDGVKARLIVSKGYTIMHLRWTVGSFKSSGSVTFPVGAFYQAMKPVCETQKMVILVGESTEYKSPVGTVANTNDKAFFDASKLGVGQTIRVSGKISKPMLVVFFCAILFALAYCIFQAHILMNNKIPAVKRLQLLKMRHLPISGGFSFVFLLICIYTFEHNIDLVFPGYWYLEEINGIKQLLISLYPPMIPELLMIVSSFLLVALARVEVELELLPHNENFARLKRSREMIYSLIPWVVTTLLAVAAFYICEDYNFRSSKTPFIISFVVVIFTLKLYSLLNISYRSQTASLDETWIQLTKGFLNGLNTKLAGYPNTRPYKMVLDDSDKGMLVPYIRKGWFGRLHVSVKTAQLMDCDELEFLVTAEACIKRSKAFWYLLGSIPAIYWVIISFNYVMTHRDLPAKVLLIVASMMLPVLAEELFRSIYTSHIKSGIRFALYYTHDKDAAVSAFDKITGWKSETSLDYPEKEMKINESELLESVVKEKKKARNSVSLD